MKLKIKPFQVALWLLLFSLHLSNLSLHDTGGDNPDGSVGVKPTHLIAAAMAVFLAPHLVVLYRQLMKELFVFFFLLNAVLVSVSQIYFDQFSPVIIKFIFAIYCLFIGYDIANRIRKEEFLRMLRIVSWVTLVAIIIKGVIYFPELRAPATRDGWKPDVPLFFAGGVNIEASMMVLASLFFAGRKNYYLFLSGAFVVSVLYLSRGSTLACIVSFMFVQLNPAQIKLTNLIFAIIVGFVGVAWLLFGENGFLVSRLANIGSDSSSSTRLEMLSGVRGAVMRWPLGHGAGNAIRDIESHQGSIREGNLHNVFAQVLVDFGVQGLVLWLAVIGRHVISMLQGKFLCPLGLFVITYFMLSSIQFTGLESFFWLILGAFQGYHGQINTGVHAMNDSGNERDLGGDSGVGKHHDKSSEHRVSRTGYTE